MSLGCRRREARDTQVGLMQTVANANDTASRQSASTSSCAASGVRSVWSMSDATSSEVTARSETTIAGVWMISQSLYASFA